MKREKHCESEPAKISFIIHLQSIEILVVDAANQIHAGANVHNARISARLASRTQLRQQQVGEHEVAQVIDGKVRFVAIGRQLEWREHNARIVYQQINFGICLRDLLRKGTHRLHIPYIELFANQFAFRLAEIDNAANSVFGTARIPNACKKNNNNY